MVSRKECKENGAYCAFSCRISNIERRRKYHFLRFIGTQAKQAARLRDMKAKDIIDFAGRNKLLDHERIKAVQDKRQNKESEL